jgi:hypothetical protein
MRKLIIAILLTFGIVILPRTSTAGNLNMVTYYPAPQGIYDRMVLLPQSGMPTPCTIGSLRTEQSSGKLFYCHDIAGVGTWGPLSLVWSESGTYLYPTKTDANPLIFLGIGTSSPNYKLTLDNDGGILATGSFDSGVITSYPINVPNQTAPANARLLWYPRKAAFRAIWDRWGVTDGSQLGAYSIGFGDTPTVTGIAATASGLFNTANSDYATIAGGKNNTATNQYPVVTGGENNIANNYCSVAGSDNQCNAFGGTIGGGSHNIIMNKMLETIGGGQNNTITADASDPSVWGSTIAGGKDNQIIDKVAKVLIGGGFGNTIQQTSVGLLDYAAIGGGSNNTNTSPKTFIGGGYNNTAHYSGLNGGQSVIGGGDSNILTGAHCVINGGSHNVFAEDDWSNINNMSTILGGSFNLIKNSTEASLIAGGASNTIAGGSLLWVYNAHASVIAGGEHNTVTSDFSWAGGRYMNLTESATQTFVWGYSDIPITIGAADAFILAPGKNSGGSSVYNPKLGINETNPSGILSITLPASSTKDFLAITSTAVANAGNIFIVKNDGHVGIGKYNPNTYPLEFGAQANGAYLTVGGVWTTPSSRELKENIQPLNEQQAIETLRALKPVTYNYKIDPTEHHVGFIAEDVPEMIAAQDRNSVDPMNIAAILTAVLKEQENDITQQDEMLTTLENNVRDLKADWTSR